MREFMFSYVNTFLKEEGLSRYTVQECSKIKSIWYKHCNNLLSVQLDQLLPLNSEPKSSLKNIWHRHVERQFDINIIFTNITFNRYYFLSS